MNRTFLTIASFFWVIVVAARAQPYQKTDSGVRLTIHSVTTEIQFYSPSLVRVLKSPEGTLSTKRSLSVVQVPDKVPFDARQIGDELRVEAERIHVILNLKSGEIAFATRSGVPLLREKEPGEMFAPRDDAGDKHFYAYASHLS